jgi:thiamine transport system permease protein
MNGWQQSRRDVSLSVTLRATPLPQVGEENSLFFPRPLAGEVDRANGARRRGAAVRNLTAPLLILIALLLGILPLISFALTRGGTILPDAYALHVTTFTLLQATLSTLISLTLAIPVARAFARQTFPGRQTLLALFAIPLSLPVIVAVFGLTTLYGNAGLFSGLINLYGLQGILLAHVFFNLPLAVRLLLEALESTAPENHRLATQLGFTSRDIWHHVDWPALKPALPRIAALIFLLCAGSFVIVLIFGGPSATTLEVAIYQSLRMDFDVDRALTLSILQVALSLVVVWIVKGTIISPAFENRFRMNSVRRDGLSFISRTWDTFAIAAAAVLVIPPLFIVAFDGIVHITPSRILLQASITSFTIALVSSLLAIALAWGMAEAQARHLRQRGALLALGLGAYLVPPAVLSTGWFIAFRTFESGWPLSIALIAAMNCLMALPFLLTVLGPALAKSHMQHDKLCAQLNLNGWNRLRRIDLPANRTALAQAALMAFVLSLGDLTAVTLLGSNGLVTLPSLVQQQMGHYQSAAAGGTALILAVLCMSLAFAAQRLSRWT